MRTRPRATSTDLRRAIDCLPERTRTAMLEGISANPIIVGAYANEDGVCPMLAAHRAGGRTSLISFARAWDRFAFRDARKGRARRATERELRVLKAHLELSLLEAEAPQTVLAQARHEHLELQRRREEDERHVARERPGDPDRSRELGRRSGWSWTRLFRRYDEYALALQRLEADPADDRLGQEAAPTDPEALLTR